MQFRLHAVEYASRANGPGLRAVVWFQGCSLGCPGCFNPETHDPLAGLPGDTAVLAADILARSSTLEGVTISGGEPFQQPAALLDLLWRLSSTPLGRLVFSGYALAEIQRLPLGDQILSHADVLIAGRFVATLPHDHGLLGSRNQQIHFLTSRYGPADLARVPPRELILHADGGVTVTGIAPWRPQA